MSSQTEHVNGKYSIKQLQRGLLVGLGCLLLVSQGFAQSQTLQALRKSDQARRGIFLYPSTIRMVNIAGLESYNELVSGIEHAYFFPLHTDRFTDHDFLKVRAALEDDEGFEEYMTLESAGNEQLYVLGRADRNETALLSHRNGKYYMGMILGHINIVKLLDLQEELQDPKTIAENPFIEQVQRLFGDRKDRESERKESMEEPSDSIEQTATKKT